MPAMLLRSMGSLKARRGLSSGSVSATPCILAGTTLSYKDWGNLLFAMLTHVCDIPWAVGAAERMT